MRVPLRERLLTRLASIDLRPRTLAAKVPFVVLVIGSLGVGLGITLWLSTDAAERSYQLGNARESNRVLLQQKEALERDVLEAESAPALAEAARELGMIPTRDTAHLVQDPTGNWVVVGVPKPAEGVPPPPLNTKLPGPAAGDTAGRGAGPVAGRRAQVRDPAPAGRRAAAGRRAGRPPDSSGPVRSAPGRSAAGACAGLPCLRRCRPTPVLPPASGAAARGHRPAPRPYCPPRPSSRPGPYYRRRPVAVPVVPGVAPTADPPARGRPRRPVGAGRRSPAGPASRGKQATPSKGPSTAGHSARDRRTRPATELGVRSASFVFRHRIGNAVILLVLACRRRQLFYLQVPRASGLRAEAAGQLKVTDIQQAMRGDIIDRNGDKLAFTIEARALTFQPIRVGKQLAEAKEKSPAAPDPQLRLQEIAKEVALRLGTSPTPQRY